jgi:hypothetical protein
MLFVFNAVADKFHFVVLTENLFCTLFLAGTACSSCWKMRSMQWRLQIQKRELADSLPSLLPFHYLFSFPVFKVFTLIYLHFLLLPRGISLFFPFASLWFRCLLNGVQGKTRFKINEVQSGSKTTTIRGSCKLGAKSTKNYAQNWNIILARASLIFLHHPTPQLSKHTPWTAVYNPSSSITMLRRSQQC